MSMIKIIVILAVVSLELAVVSKAQSIQEREGLVLLRSTCSDVKRVFDVDKCEYPRSTYRLKDRTISVMFERDACAPASDSKTSEDEAEPNGVVSSIMVQLYEPAPLTNFIKDKSKWESLTTDFLDEVIYSNGEEGMTVYSVSGKVRGVTYDPSMKYKQLLCHSKP